MVYAEPRTGKIFVGADLPFAEADHGVHPESDGILPADVVHGGVERVFFRRVFPVSHEKKPRRRCASARAGSSLASVWKSGRVVGVHVDVIDGQVGGPEANLGVPFLEEELKACIPVRADIVGDRLLVELDGRAVFVKQVSVDFKRDLGRVVGDAAAAGRGDNAAPVGVGAADRRLNERVVGDRLRERLGGRAVFCAEHVDRNEVRDAFAVVRNHGRELLEHVEYELGERVEVGPFERFGRGGAVGQKNDRVARARVPFDADAVKGVFDGIAENLLGVFRIEHGVGNNRREHRRHIRADHCRAFAHSGDSDRLAVWERGLARDRLDFRVGRHNGGRGLFEIFKRGSEFGRRFFRAGRDPAHWEVDADDAGRHDERLVAGIADRFARVFRHFARVEEPDAARARVRAAGVGRDDVKASAGRAFPVVNDRRAAVKVLGIDAGGGCGSVGNDEREVEFGRIGPDSAMDAREPVALGNIKFVFHVMLAS